MKSTNCAITGCLMPPKPDEPLCAPHREKLPFLLVTTIDREYAYMHRGHKGAALRFAQAVGHAKRTLAQQYADGAKR